MAILQLNLPEKLKAAAEQRAAAAGYGSVDDYIASLIEADEIAPISDEMEAELLKSLASGAAVDVTSDFVTELKRRVRKSRNSGIIPWTLPRPKLGFGPSRHRIWKRSFNSWTPNPPTPRTVSSRNFFYSANLLAEMPRLGPVRRTRGRLKGLRSWPLTNFGPYVLFYLPIEGGIEVIRIFHGARNVDRELRK